MLRLHYAMLSGTVVPLHLEVVVLYGRVVFIVRPTLPTLSITSAP